MNMKDPSAADDQARWWKGLFLYHRDNSDMKHYRKNRIGEPLNQKPEQIPGEPGPIISTVREKARTLKPSANFPRS